MNLSIILTQKMFQIFFFLLPDKTTTVLKQRGWILANGSCMAMVIPLIGGSCKVMLVVAFGFLPQNFGRFQGPMNNTLSFYE